MLVIEDDPNFVVPDVYRVGYTEVDEDEIQRYLIDSGNTEFRLAMDAAREAGLSSAEILCSMFAKLCYKSLTLGHNTNITRTRDIWDNLVGCFDTGHGSIFEHVGFNFLIRDCSRVFTHELVRHRIGTAFSQTSGRYCRLDHIPLVWDPILDPVKDLFRDCVRQIEDTVYLAECILGLRKPSDKYPNAERGACLSARNDILKGHPGFDNWEEARWVPDNSFNFTLRKKITSAIRRIAPNGQSNEIAFSCNLRTLRHTVLMRTAGFAEWEIRHAFAQIYNLIKDKYPLAFYGAKETVIDGIVQVSGMKMQPYEANAKMLLDEMSDDELKLYMETRIPKSA